ncbi:MAG: DUF433 domain-containing protein [Phycisphaera sp. RhM]|nr:DUF433 domain-containing protein [Phycisphaera sp. RhM]
MLDTLAAGASREEIFKIYPSLKPGRYSAGSSSQGSVG